MCENITSDEDKLAKELANAVIEDDRRKAVDEMKKRSVMDARSYDEFRHLVGCARDGQKPVSRKEMEFLGNPTKREQYLYANQRMRNHDDIGKVNAKLRNDAGDVVTVQNIKIQNQQSALVSNSNEIEIPKNSSSFEKFWRRKDFDNETRLHVLLHLDVETVFKVDMPDLGQVLNCILLGIDCDSENCERMGKILSFLSRLSMMGRFRLAVDFLSSKDLDVAKQVIERLDMCANLDVEMLLSLRKTFGL